MIRARAGMLLAVALTAALAAVSAPRADALERSVTLVSGGELERPRVRSGVDFAAASTDLRRVFLRTMEQLTGSDGDEFGVDVFMWAGGKTTLLTGSGPGTDKGAELQAVSPGGTRLVWSTEEAVTPNDVSGPGSLCRDVYVTDGGRIGRVSTGPTEPRACRDANFLGASRDLGRIVFTTAEPLVPADADEDWDVYLRAGGETTLVRGPGDARLSFARMSADGRRMFVASTAPLAPSDTDALPDAFVMVGGRFRQITLGPAGGNGPLPSGEPFAPSLAEITPDGRHAWFYTPERLTADDRDDRMDLYRNGPGGTRLVSTGPAGGNGPFDVGKPRNPGYDDLDYGELGAVSTDGRRTFFVTPESLTREDRDDDYDVYLRSGERTVLVSPRHRGKTSRGGANLVAASSDGRRAVLATRERLTRDDRDDSIDAFLWEDGTLRRITGGTRNGNRDEPFQLPAALGKSPSRASDVSVNHVSRDARRVYFSTGQPLTRDARSKVYNLYEHAGGKTTLVRLRGDTGRTVTLDYGRAAVDPTPVGRDFAVTTSEPLVRADRDTESDVYVARLAARGRR